MPRVPALLTLLALCSASAGAQPSAPPPAFAAADVHPSPRRSYPFYFAVVMPQEHNRDRFVIRDATMVDLIATAWKLAPENVQGGPNWLERDRFDIIAALPHGTPKASQALMLRALLAQRFHLVLHDDMRPLPAYVLSVSKTGPKLKVSSGSGDPHCDDKTQRRVFAAPQPDIVISCKNLTMDALAQNLHDMAGGYLSSPVVNATSLPGAFDLDLTWTGHANLARAGSDGISIFDAVNRQLGLKLALETAPRPVLVVDSVDRKPTPNAPDLNNLLPPPVLPQFEVATIKPSKPDVHPGGRITGEEVNFQGMSLKNLVDLACDLNENAPDQLVNAPKWLSDRHFDVHAKVSPESTGSPLVGDLPMDIYEVQDMLRALIVERFQIKAHMEERPTEAYTLIASAPHMKRADPGVRASCKEGPGPDGKDPRLTNPLLSRLVNCRSMTMPQLADELQLTANGYIFGPVLDSTALEGAFDFTLSFSDAGQYNSSNGGTVGAPAGGSATASDPAGALSIFDALNRQLGLKLVRQRRPAPVLVLDHIEERPTEN